MESTKNILYAVLKLVTTVEIEDVTGNKFNIKLSGFKGYIPVFETKKEAEAEACDGKYEIIAINTFKQEEKP